MLELFRAAIKLAYKTGWTLEYISDLDIEQVMCISLAFELEDIKQGRLYGFLLPKESGSKGKSRSNDDRWSTKTWQEDMGGNKTRVKTRINVMDLWENPGLLNQAIKG